MSNNQKAYQELKEKLEDLKAPENWGEFTGPFFHVRFPRDVSSGPYFGVKLKELFDESPCPEGTLVRDAKGLGDWSEYYSHPFFQRRKPQLVSIEEFPEEHEEILILKDGQKHGPISFQELHELLNQKEILLTDQVSLDAGYSWKKLFEYEEFDRRQHEPSSLPESPGWEVFRGSNEEIEENLLHPNEQSLETDAIAGLAFLENLKSGKTANVYDKVAPKDAPEPEEELPKNEVIQEAATETSPTRKPPLTKKYAYIAAIVFFLGASAFVIFDNPQEERNLATQKPGNPTQEAPEIKPVNEKDGKGKARSYRSPRLKPRQNPPSRQPASITNSDSFKSARERAQERKMQDRPIDDHAAAYPGDSYGAQDPYENTLDEESYYDRGETPVEQDPVRKKLDKKTIDSEKSYFDPNEEEIYNDYRERAEDFRGEAEELAPAEVWGVEREDQNIEMMEAEEGFYQDEGAY